MIGNRIRKGPRQPKRDIHLLAPGLFTLTRYLVDARPWLEAEPGIRRLTQYTLHADIGDEPGEKVEAYGTFNLVGDNLRDWQMQMLAVAARGRGMRDPVEHFVVSWRAGEKPSAQQVEETAAIVLRTCGYERCPAIWSCHSNTSQHHAHIAFVRVDPLSGRAQGNGWDLDRLHQALAIVEEKQGWSSERNAIYVARDGAVYERRTNRLVRAADGRTVAHRSEGAQLPRGISEVAADLSRDIIQASDWTDLHRRLEARGAAYRRKGSGAVVRRAGAECKASQLGRSCGLKELEKRIGPFEVSLASHGYEAYLTAHRVEIERLRAIRDRERARLKAWLNATLASCARGHPALAAAIKGEYAAALEALNAAFASAEDGFDTSRLTEDQWRSGGAPTAPPVARLPTLILPASTDYSELQAQVNAGLACRISGWRTQYFAKNGSRAFDDIGVAILLYNFSDEAVDAALKLAASRWNTVRVVGPIDMVEQCFSRAEALGIAVVDANGQPPPAPPPVEEQPVPDPDVPGDAAEPEPQTDEEHAESDSARHQRDLAWLQALKDRGR